MDHPFELKRNHDEHMEEEDHKLKLRTGLLIGLFFVVMLSFASTLFQLQIVQGDSYLERASYPTARMETVNSARGQILDRNGQVLVGNALSYHVELDTSLMGSERNTILAALLSLCREEGVKWTDSLPVSASYPWRYTKAESLFSYQVEGEDGERLTRLTSLGRLAEACGWIEDPAKDWISAEALLREMCATFRLELAETMPITREIRALAGVLYELSLRTYEVVYTDYVFAEDINISFISKVKEQALTGVLIRSTTSRQYNTTYGAHLLGRTGKYTSDEMWRKYKELGYPYDAVVGLEGVELAFEAYLHGSSGARRVEMDDNGSIITQNWVNEPDPGDHVVLTIDLDLQRTTEDLLADFMSGLAPTAGAAAVVLDMSGGVLALASYPTYDLSTYSLHFNDLYANEGKPLTNRATQGLYAPGSTFKMVTAVAALSEGVITPTSTVSCTGRYTYYPDVSPACWIWNSIRGTHGSENVTSAITDSCNIFFYDVGRRVGITKLVEYATQFGLGQYTGIEINESKGRVAGPATSARFGQTWYDGSTMYAAIGQDNNQFTPLQLANYIATLVNGGKHYQVHLLKEVVPSDDSQAAYAYEPVLTDTVHIDPGHLDAVKQGMYDLSQTASMARHFSPLPVSVGCKTGTAEVLGATANSVFVCFAPYDNPQVALCLVAEQGASGASLASVAAGILNQYFSSDNTRIPIHNDHSALLR